MPVSPRLIKGRIKSVANTRKITKAMELVAASKMRKAVQMTLASRAYAGAVRTLVDNVRHYVDPSLHPFLAGGERPRGSSNALVLIASSDRGLCGGFNAQLLKKALTFIRDRTGDVRVVTVGRRAEAAVRREGIEIVASFEAISHAPSYEASVPVGRYVVSEFSAGRADLVFAAYTDFKSTITQIPTIEQLLPVIPEAELKWDMRGVGQGDARTGNGIVFEPAPGYVLDQLLPRLVETRLYQALLESAASEHAARMMAMHSATDNATGMLDDLTFTYNQARQAGITREISEISAGKAALE